MTKNTKRVLSLVLVVVMLMGMGKTTFATEIPLEQANVILDNQNKRVAVYGGTTATLDKESNTMYITDGTNSYSFSMDTASDEILPATRANTTISSESVALHRYEYIRTDSGKYFWAVDIPSYSINPNNWCGWLSVWDDKSVEGKYGVQFADYIDAAENDEIQINTYGGAVTVAIIVGLVSKNPIFVTATFKAACAAAGVAVSLNILASATSYYENLSNAREKYFSIRQILG